MPGSPLNTAYGPPSAWGAFKMGRQKNGSDLVKSSTITVKVSDSTTSLPGNYTVNWHLPTDNWVPVAGSDVWLTPYKAPVKIVGVTSPTSYPYYSVEKDQLAPPEVAQFDYGKTLSNAGTLVGAGTGFLAIAGSAGVPGAAGLAASGPVGVGLMLAAAGLSVAGSFVETPETPSQKMYDARDAATSYAVYKAAVESAGRGETWADGTAKFQGDVGKAKASFAGRSTLYGSDQTTHSDDDQYAIVKVKGNAIFARKQRTWQGDEWGEHGYAGQVPGHLTRSVSTPEFQLTFYGSGDTTPASASTITPTGG